MSNPRLAAATQRGETTNLFEEHADRLLATVSRIVHTSPVNIEDACAFAWLQLIRYRPDHAGAFGWLRTTAIREAAKLHRPTSRTVPLDEIDEEVADSRHELDGRRELIAAGQQLREARLRPREARLLGLRVAGYSREEMAELTGETCRTLDRQLGRAQRKLRVARRAEAGYADAVSAHDAGPVVEEVLRFEDLPPGELASRRAVVRWSDGTEGEAVRFYADEVLFSEGDLVGKTREQLRSLHFRRDRDWLQSSG